ncbi:DHH family phosphoesterase [Litchfieldia salsa]|uniref:Oligoribonuclease NrnB or cAMP/cGMP phosphodiesterase, DHH superfamily n=1 Tax=Litchfieldia salsa TaxID=930152 RepID=A0A1H0TD78_9BACI|nr:DHHA1 domain-containing protein [Litchfieldia salsa]SDP51977.1 Oligoribonuclease NrnB or cAMP/cGMP phosphodiesterase, DHH superfamily [Litchfieldia salsa]
MIMLFTDSDLDGLGCGLLAKLAFGEKVNVAYCSYRNLNERVSRFIGNQENKNAKVYITDLAVNKDVEKKLEKRYKNQSHVQMIDHHVTAMHFNEYDWGFVKPEYDSGKKTSATSLYYEFLVEKEMITSTKALDEFVELVRQYDTWEWEVNENKDAKRLNDLFFILGIEHFEKEMLERVKNAEGFSLSEKEELILDLEDKKIERYIFSKNRQMTQIFVDEYCVGIIHAEQYLSELGNALAKLNPHIDLIAMVNVGTKKIGFRTIYDDVDVSKFAQKYGGGGHPKASGCSLDEGNFDVFVKDVFPLSSIKIDAPKNELNIRELKNGSFYTNKTDDQSFVFFDEKVESWKVYHNKQFSDQKFDSYEEAEKYIKRHYSTGLAFDNDLVRFLAEMLDKKEQEIRSDINSNRESVVNKLILQA